MSKVDIPRDYVSSHSESVIKELRAGLCLTDAARLFITIWMLQQQQSVSFQPINRPPAPPHIESANNLLFGKPKPYTSSTRHMSNFDQQQFSDEEYPSATTLEEAQALPNVMTFDEAESYAKANLAKRLYINDRHYVSELMAAKKLPHSDEVGFNPSHYCMKDEHLKLLKGRGLYRYLQKGYRLPPR